MWHLSTVRFPLPVALCFALALVGCATPQEKLARQQKKAARQEAAANTRATEQRRMLAIENGEVNSGRGAEIYMPDKTKVFDPSHATASAAHSYGTSQAHTKDFNTDRNIRLDTYQTRDFYGSKPNQAGQRTYATGEAATKGKYLLTDATKKAGTKTAATKEAWDANKVAPTHALADGSRLYLGPERKKLNQQIDAKELANWRNGGESVIYTDGAIEKVSNVKQLSIDDIRELLNKSK